MQVNTERLELGCDGTVVPSCKDSACVGAKGDYVSELFEGWEGLVDGDAVALSVTFYRSGKATKAWDLVLVLVLVLLGIWMSEHV